MLAPFLFCKDEVLGIEAMMKFRIAKAVLHLGRHMYGPSRGTTAG
jgi:hypothetical protein